MRKTQRPQKNLKRGQVSRGSLTLDKAPNVLTIDPALFTSSQWQEADAVDADGILDLDRHPTATYAQVLALADYCRAKARRVADGELGESCATEGLDINEWALDLIGAAEVLEKLAGVESRPRPKSVLLTVRERDTILAALRVWQALGNIPADIPSLRPEQAKWIEAIATEHGDALLFEDIDAICERINR
jgi:hypothetical protein